MSQDQRHVHPEYTVPLHGRTWVDDHVLFVEDTSPLVLLARRASITPRGRCPIQCIWRGHQFRVGRDRGPYVTPRKGRERNAPHLHTQCPRPFSPMRQHTSTWGGRRTNGHVYKKDATNAAKANIMVGSLPRPILHSPHLKVGTQIMRMIAYVTSKLWSAAKSYPIQTSTQLITLALPVHDGRTESEHNGSLYAKLSCEKWASTA